MCPLFPPARCQLAASPLLCLRLQAPARLQPPSNLAVLATLPALSKLALVKCCLRELPGPLADTTTMRCLLLDASLLTEVPEGPYLSRLERLSLSSNRLSTFPAALLSCTSLEQLSLVSVITDSQLMSCQNMMHVSARDLRSLLHNNPRLRRLLIDARGASFGRDLTSAQLATLASQFPQAQVVEVEPGRSTLEEDPDSDFGGAEISSNEDDSGDEEGTSSEEESSSEEEHPPHQWADHMGYDSSSSSED